MSLYQKASLVQIPSGTKVNKLYSVVPNNGDGDFTGTAIDADATRINKDGLVENVSTNVARLNYDLTNPQDPHLLIEPARTNYAINSNNISSWNNITQNGTITATANHSTAPDGTQTATRLQMSVSGTGFALKAASVFGLTGNYASTVYLKTTSGNTQNVCMSGRNTPNAVFSVTGEWQRFEINGSTTSGLSAYMNVGIYTSFSGADNPIDILVWGGQLEFGDYATSLIPTASSAVTRTEDNIYGAGDANLFNDTEGTLFVDVEPFTYEGVARITLSDSSIIDRIVIGTANSTQFRILVIQGGSPPFRMDTFRNITYNTRNKIAVTYKQNEYKLAINGTVVLTTTSSGLTPQGLNQLRFSDGDSGLKWRGKVFQTMVFNEALSNTELQELTSL